MDGFDELTVFGSDKADELLSVRKLEDWLKKYPESKFIISTRPNSRLKDSSYEYHKKHPYIILKKFNDNLQNIWINKWNEYWKEHNVDLTFPKDNINIAKVKMLLGTPLFLFIAAYTSTRWINPKHDGTFKMDGTLRHDRKSVALNRSQLYKLLLEATIEGKFQGTRNWWIELGLNNNDYENFLCEIAYLIFNSNKRSITSQELKIHLSNTKFKDVVDAIVKKRPIKDVFLCFFFQHDDTNNNFTFAHQSMMEFLVAQYYNKLNKEAELLKYLTDPIWGEVFLFYIDMLGTGIEDFILLQMLSEAEKLIRNEEKIIDILSKLKEKTDSVKAGCKPALVRFFYLSMFISWESFSLINLDSFLFFEYVKNIKQMLITNRDISSEMEVDDELYSIFSDIRLYMNTELGSLLNENTSNSILDRNKNSRHNRKIMQIMYKANELIYRVKKVIEKGHKNGLVLDASNVRFNRSIPVVKSWSNCQYSFRMLLQNQRKLGYFFELEENEIKILLKYLNIVRLIASSVYNNINALNLNNKVLDQLLLPPAMN